MLALIAFLIIVIIAILLFGSSAVLGVFGFVIGLILAFFVYAMAATVFESMSGSDWAIVALLATVAAVVGYLRLKSPSETNAAAPLEDFGAFQHLKSPEPSPRAAKLLNTYRSLTTDTHLIEEAERYYRSDNTLALQRLVSIERSRMDHSAHNSAAPPRSNDRVKHNEERNRELMEAIKRSRLPKAN